MSRSRACFRSTGTAPAEARRHCTRSLAEMLSDRPGADGLIASAELIVSELLTNAIRADSSAIELVLAAADGVVRIEVVDDAVGSPVLRTPNVDERGGRGLLIVQALSSSWGVDYDSSHKTVWVELILPAVA